MHNYRETTTQLKIVTLCLEDTSTPHITLILLFPNWFLAKCTHAVDGYGNLLFGPAQLVVKETPFSIALSNVTSSAGLFCVSSTNFFVLNLRDPHPISIKFGTLADDALKKICANFQRCTSSSFRDMTFQKMGNRSIFATRQVSQMSITFFC